MSVTVQRFVRVLTGGTFVTDELVRARDGKVAEALNALRAQLARLSSAGLQHLGLAAQLNTLDQARQSALARPDNQGKCDALEAVKNSARAAAATAKPAVDGFLADAARRAQRAQEALNAANAAATAIGKISEPVFAQPLGKRLAGVQNERITLSSQVDAPLLQAAEQALAACANNANALTATANQVLQILPARASALADIDKSLAEAQAELPKIVDAPLQKLFRKQHAELTQERTDLANAGPDQIAGELAKAPALLARVNTLKANAVSWAKWGETAVERTLIAGACDAYSLRAKKDSLDWLEQGAAGVKAALDALIKQAANDPQAALFGLRALQRNTYKTLSDRFKNELLAPPLMKQVDDLAKADPSSPEAQMQTALAPDQFKERLLDAVNTTVAFGANPSKLSPGEMVAVYTYTTNDFKEMNALLLGLPSAPIGKQKADTEIKNAEAAKAVQKLPPYGGGVTRRGESEWPGADAQYQPGNVFTVKAFWSTGVGYNFPGKYQISVHGNTGRNVAPMSAYPKESEVLFVPGTQFRVLSRDGSDPTKILVVVQEV
ncbi:MAG: hypothetical protein J0I21_06400 [Alphaproteobacteria bacterium]|nr:hypothetical protein [Alphaproteobacteria bacterium]